MLPNLLLLFCNSVNLVFFVIHAGLAKVLCVSAPSLLLRISFFTVMIRTSALNTQCRQCQRYFSTAEASATVRGFLRFNRDRIGVFANECGIFVSISQSKPRRGRPNKSGLQREAPHAPPLPADLRKYLESIRGKLGIHKLADWYPIELSTLASAGLHNLFGLSQFDLFKRAYPEHEWHPWLFNKVPVSFWRDGSNQRQFLDWAYKKLGYSSMNGWYHLTSDEIKKLGGGHLQNTYGGSVTHLLQTVYPEHPWQTWKFDIVPRGFWKSRDNQKAFIADYEKEHGITDLGQWYSFSSELTKKTRLASMLNVLKMDLPRFIMGIHSDHAWEPWRFTRLPGSWWESREHRREYFDYLSGVLSLPSPSLLLNVSIDEVHQNFGGTLLYTHYGNSLLRAAIDLYPEVSWRELGVVGDQLLTPLSRKSFNKSISMRKEKIAHIGYKLGVDASNLDAWYTIRREDFMANGGAALLKYHRNSLQLALQEAYPEHNWQPDMFSRKSGLL